MRILDFSLRQRRKCVWKLVWNVKKKKKTTQPPWSSN